MNKLICFTITLFLCIFSNYALAEKYDDCVILVSSCDKYSELWSPFFKLLEENWPELNTTHKDLKVYLLANKKSYTSPKVQMINIPNEISWSDNMLVALDKIDAKYVILFLDDYWLNSKVDQKRLDEIFATMRKMDAAYVQLYMDAYPQKVVTPVLGIKDVAYKNKFQKYRASLQLAIWETKAIKQILRSGENPWEFELAASIRSSGYPKDFLIVRDNMPIDYINASYQGHILPEAVTLAKKFDPTYTNSLPVLTKEKWDLKLKELKSRWQSVKDLVTRNIGNCNVATYRYTYEN